MKNIVLAAALGVATTGSSIARADPPAAPPTSDDDSFSVPATHPGHWARGSSRWFLSSTIDVGYLYLRPRLTAGYGKPFVLWAGADANPIASSSGLGAYAGLRGQIPWGDLRVGARGFRAFDHKFLAPQDHYDTRDLQTGTGSLSQYITLEAELSGGVPVGPGSVLLVLTASSVQGVPAGNYVYEETLRVITNPPAIYRARTGYALRLGSEGNARVGLVAEVLDLPGRSELLYRGGVVASFAIDDHLEALGLLVVPIWSRDSLGIAGGDFAELGIRYRWATGHDEARQNVADLYFGQ
jgi:hypothetical protein